MQTNRRNLLGSALALPAIAMPTVATATVETSYHPYAARDGGLWWRLFARMTRMDVTGDILVEAASKLPEEGARSKAFERAERVCDASYQLLWRLLKTPAPDVKAALWKFDYLFKPEDGETPAWNLEHENVRLALADVRRCLGGEV